MKNVGSRPEDGLRCRQGVKPPFTYTNTTGTYKTNTAFLAKAIHKEPIHTHTEQAPLPLAQRRSKQIRRVIARNPLQTSCEHLAVLAWSSGLYATFRTDLMVPDGCRLSLSLVLLCRPRPPGWHPPGPGSAPWRPPRAGSVWSMSTCPYDG